MNAAAPIIGIDFGTSNSKMAWYNPKTNQPEIILNREGESETPSVVYFGEQHTLVGTPAVEMLEYEQERERVIMSVKRELIATPLLALPGKALTPTEVAAEILRKLKRDAEDLHFHRELTRAVITYPASFGPLERDKIREAARLAGFAEVELLEEPVAAAMAYAQMGLQVGKYVLVYDLGGGTFDLAVLACEEDGAFRLALEPQGIKRCGGDDFDEALYQHCDGIAREKLKRSISQTGKRDLHFLQQCRQRKENLSTSERRVFKAYLEPGAVLFQYELDRVTFEGLISTTVEETVRKTKALVEQANADGQAVDTMVLIGGSSRVPLVQRLLEKQLVLKPLSWQYRDAAVALGAAYHAYTSLGPEKQYRRMVEKIWADKKLDRKQIAYLYDLADKLALGDEQADAIESEVMGDIKEWVFVRHYKPVVSQPVGTSEAGKAVEATKLYPVKPPAGLKPEELTLVHTLTGHSDGIRSVALTADGQTLASGSDDQTIKVWNVQSGQVLRTLSGHTHVVWSVAFSPDGQTLASGSRQLLRTLSEHTNVVWSVAFSPDGQTLASGSDDQTIKVWNVQSGQVLRTLSGHTNYVNSVAISPDGQTLASGSDDKTIKIWGKK